MDAHVPERLCLRDARVKAAVRPVCASVGGAIFGLDSGVFATAVSLVSEQAACGDALLSAFAGLGFLGTFFSAVAGGRLADRFGRKAIILVGAAVYALGSVLMIAGTFFGVAFSCLMLGRFLSGSGLGLIMLAVPLYLSEMAEPNRRGRTVGMFQLQITLGILVGALAAFGLNRPWQCFLIPSLAALTFLFVAVRLPPSLVSRPRDETSASVGRMLRLPAFWLVLAIGALVPLSGIGPVMDYSVTLFKRVGFGHLGANGVDVMIKGVNLLMTFPSLALVDRLGRRTLMWLGSAVMTLSLGVSAAAFACAGTAGPVVAAVGCLFYVAAFAVGPGVCMWLVIPEALPSVFRARGMAAALLADYVAVTVLLSSFLPLVSWLGLPVAFGMLALFSATLTVVSLLPTAYRTPL